jgi:hypothetical protein
MTKWKPDSWMGPWEKGTKHTPGPWFWTAPRKVGEHHPAGSVYEVRANYSLDDKWRGYVTGVLAGSANAEANARLIAAAPDMLAALQEVEWIFDGEEDITNNGGPNNAMKALQVVRAALRKAGAA